MVLETTMLCLDNSEWMRNGDYGLSRIDSQNDAANMISKERTDSNPENTVGVLSMAGQGVELLVSPTEDISKILACFSKLTLGGKSDFGSSVQIAQLALKHRKNKNGGQRIIAFVGSPIIETAVELAKIGKLLKKNNIAVDIITVGELECNLDKLTEFINAVNSGENSHLINVPPGVSPTDAILTSPIMQDSPYAGAYGARGGSSGGGMGDDFGGIDASLDPELAMAIRVSTEEARAQEEARALVIMNETRPADSSAATAAASSTAHAQQDFDDDESLMQQALEMSMREIYGDAAAVGESAPTSAASGGVDEAGNDMDEEDALRIALELSMVETTDVIPSHGTGSAPVTASPTGTSSVNEAMEALGIEDPEFLSTLLGSVDVDMNDPLILAALAQLTGSKAPQGEVKGSKKRKPEDGAGDEPSGES